MSTSLVFDLGGIAQASQRIAALDDLNNELLLDAIGAEVETQTRRRIREEKTAPDGTPWPEWSENYAETRHGGHSLLMGDGDLEDSIQYLIGNDQVEIGSNLVYAAHHNFGGNDIGTGIPQREYLGFSEENLIDIGDVLIDELNEQLTEVFNRL